MAKNFLNVAPGIAIKGQSTAPLDPVNGDIYYNTSDDEFQFYQDGSWTSLGGGSSTSANVDKFYGDATWTCPSDTHKVTASVQATLLPQISGSSFITPGRDLYRWGSNNGALGNGTTLPQSSPILVSGGLKFKQCSHYTTAATAGITVNGDLYTWGPNFVHGVLGLGFSDGGVSYPTLVPGGHKFQSVANVLYATSALTDSGDIYSWGNGADGQLGLGDVVSRSTPTLLPGGHKWRAISKAYQATFAIRNNGDLYAWGHGGHGLLGNGTSATPVSTPTLVLGGIKWKSVAGSIGNNTGDAFSSGISEAGDLYTWGSNIKGQLGLGNNVNYSTPQLVPGGMKWSTVAAAQSDCAAITVDGDLYLWGANQFGTLGQGDVTPRSVPTLLLSPAKKWLEVHCTGISFIALTTDGEVYSWGDNGNGRLGLGDVVARSTPTLVFGGLKVSTLRESELNRKVFDVEPNSAYDLKVDATRVTFNQTTLYEVDASYPTTLTLEYDS